MRETVREWREVNGQVPSPWALYKGRKVVSAQFLWLGHYIFSLTNEEDLVLDSDRQGFNQAAYDAFPLLVNMIVELPKLPPAIKDLVISFSRRFVNNVAGQVQND
jgi:hypothetical protein